MRVVVAWVVAWVAVVWLPASALVLGQRAGSHFAVGRLVLLVVFLCSGGVVVVAAGLVVADGPNWTPPLVGSWVAVRLAPAGRPAWVSSGGA